MELIVKGGSMKKLNLILLVPILAMAANVYIWNYDRTDTFYDSQIGLTVDCAYWLEQTLDALGHTYTTDTLLPPNLNGYEVCFVTCGWYSC